MTIAIYLIVPAVAICGCLFFLSKRNRPRE
jgi:hypothetical protein